MILLIPNCMLFWCVSFLIFSWFHFYYYSYYYFMFCLVSLHKMIKLSRKWCLWIERLVPICCLLIIVPCWSTATLQYATVVLFVHCSHLSYLKVINYFSVELCAFWLVVIIIRFRACLFGIRWVWQFVGWRFQLLFCCCCCFENEFNFMALEIIYTRCLWINNWEFRFEFTRIY